MLVHLHRPGVEYYHTWASFIHIHAAKTSYVVGGTCMCCSLDSEEGYFYLRLEEPADLFEQEE